MINDFYSDLEKQSYWKFTEKTGLHINIGSNNKVEWNPIKGLMLLNDFNKEDNIRNYTTTALSWVRLRFINQSPSPSDVLQYSRQIGKINCSTCCPA